MGRHRDRFEAFQAVEQREVPGDRLGLGDLLLGPVDDLNGLNRLVYVGTGSNALGGPRGDFPDANGRIYAVSAGCGARSPGRLRVRFGGIPTTVY